MSFLRLPFERRPAGLIFFEPSSIAISAAMGVVCFDYGSLEGLWDFVAVSDKNGAGVIPETARISVDYLSVLLTPLSTSLI